MIKVTLTNEILKKISSIEENRFLLSTIELPPMTKNRLRKNSKKKSSYASNKIEGNRLTSEQTEAIFNTSSFIPKSDDLIKLDDLTESKNHFKLFDYMLDNVDALLTKDMIIEMNKILKRNASD